MRRSLVHRPSFCFCSLSGKSLNFRYAFFFMSELDSQLHDNRGIRLGRHIQFIANTVASEFDGVLVGLSVLASAIRHESGSVSSLPSFGTLGGLSRLTQVRKTARLCRFSGSNTRPGRRCNVRIYGSALFRFNFQLVLANNPERSAAGKFYLFAFHVQFNGCGNAKVGGQIDHCRSHSFYYVRRNVHFDLD